MIETISTNSPLRPQREPRLSENEGGAGFSLVLAQTTLTERAATSLETFGSAPADAAGKPTSATLAQENAKTAVEHQRAGALQNSASETGPLHRDRADAAAPPSSVAQPSAQPGATPALPAAVNTAPATSWSAPSPSGRAPGIETSAMRTADRQSVSADAAAKARSPQPLTQSRTADFAEVLARRLDSGATNFRFRLDPPELGRVEGRLQIGDDGATTLALKFDNQAALDLYQADRMALVAMLKNMGAATPDNLSFSLNERNAERRTHEPAPASAAIVAAALSDTESPGAANGVLDIRI